MPFGQPDAAGRQSLQLRALADAEAREDGAGGELVLEGTTGETPAGDCARMWAGRIAGPFHIDLSLLAVVNGAVGKGDRGRLVGLPADDAANSGES
jgi:hypothetical protein